MFEADIIYQEPNWKETPVRPDRKKPYTPPPVGIRPCDGCQHETLCKKEKLACNAFHYWVCRDANSYTAPRLKERKGQKVPTTTIYKRIFGDDDEQR
ncbi:hypothetical protein GCM10023116_03950 [Kistimonas scapharcae]|uniref:Transposase n=1 Tax=Kistimonas scapharcae TaxID=1036133 RepID=A0ABP8UW54_9GAMM